MVAGFNRGSFATSKMPEAPISKLSVPPKGGIGDSKCVPFNALVRPLDATECIFLLDPDPEPDVAGSKKPYQMVFAYGVR